MTDINIGVSVPGVKDVVAMDTALDRLFKTLSQSPSGAGLASLTAQVKELRAFSSGGSQAIDAQAAALRSSTETYLKSVESFQTRLEAALQARKGRVSQKMQEAISATEERFARERKALQAGYASLETTVIASEVHLAEVQRASAKTASADAWERRIAAFKAQSAIDASGTKTDLSSRYRPQSDLATQTNNLGYLRGLSASPASADTLLGVQTAGRSSSASVFKEAFAAEEAAAKLAKASSKVATAEDAARLKQLNSHLSDFSLKANDAHAAARGLASGFGAMWLTWGSVVPLVATAAISNSFAQIVKLGADVAHTMEVIGALGDNSAAGMAALNKQMLDLAATGPFGPQEIAGAMKELTLAGLSANAVYAALPDVLNFAVAGTTDLTTAAKTLVQVTTAFGRDANSFNHFGDVISKTAAVSMSSVESISEAFKTASVVNKQYGVSLNDVATGLAALSQLGIQGSAAGTALRNMYADLSGKSKQVAALLKSNGIDLRDENGKFKDALTITETLYNKLYTLKGKARADLLQGIVGERGSKELVELLALYADNIGTFSNGAKNAFEELRNKIADSAGFQIEKSAVLAQTVQKQMEGVKSSLQGAFVGTFDGIQEEIRATAYALKDLFNSEGFKTVLGGFATAVSIVTRTLAEHAVALATVAGAYLALRVAASLQGFSGFATTLATLTQLWTGKAAAVASTAGALEGAAVATTAVSVAAVRLRAALSLLNPILVVVTAGLIAYEWWSDKSSKKAAEDRSFDDYLDRLKKEADRLEAVNVQLAMGKSLKDANAAVEGSSMLDGKRKVSEDAGIALKAAMDAANASSGYTSPELVRRRQVAVQARLQDKLKADGQLFIAEVTAAKAREGLRKATERQETLAQANADALAKRQEAARKAVGLTGDQDAAGKPLTGSAINRPVSASIRSEQERLKEAKLVLQDQLDELDHQTKLGHEDEYSALNKKAELELDYLAQAVDAAQTELNLSDKKVKNDVERAALQGKVTEAEQAYWNRSNKWARDSELLDRKKLVLTIQRREEYKQFQEEEAIARNEAEKAYRSEYEASAKLQKQAENANKLYAYELSLAGETKEQRQIALDARKRELDLAIQIKEIEDKYTRGTRKSDDLSEAARQAAATQHQGVVDKVIGDKRAELVENLADAIAEGIETGGQAGGDALLKYLKQQFILNPIKAYITGVLSGSGGGGSDFLGGLANSLIKGISGFGSAGSFNGPIAEAGLPALLPGLESFALPLATGTPYVPQDMLALIHEGEAVVPKKWNNEDTFGGGGGTTTQVSNSPTINIDARADQGATQALIQSALTQNNTELFRMLRQQGVLA